MDIEFHYYITYLIATRAGIPPEKARILAYSSQYVDDNDWDFTVNRGTDSEYSNAISQTDNLLKPKREHQYIYPLLHFIPGEPDSPTAVRADNSIHEMNTTPNSPNANILIDKAIESNDFYRIGIMSHGYVDTWAHQNFVGCYDDFNKCGSFSMLPNLGHAQAKHKPDIVTLIWYDKRLEPDLQRVSNKARFLDAARHLFRKLVPLGNSVEDMDAVEESLVKDISDAIGEESERNSLLNWKPKAQRMRNYKELALSDVYGGVELPDYDKFTWFKDAIHIYYPPRMSRLIRDSYKRGTYSWQDEDNHKQSHWYCYQEALKAHKEDAKIVLIDRLLPDAT